MKEEKIVHSMHDAYRRLSQWSTPVTSSVRLPARRSQVQVQQRDSPQRSFSTTQTQVLQNNNSLLMSGRADVMEMNAILD